MACAQGFPSWYDQLAARFIDTEKLTWLHSVLVAGASTSAGFLIAGLQHLAGVDLNDEEDDD